MGSAVNGIVLLLRFLLGLILLPLLLFLARSTPSTRKKIYFMPEPVMNNKYWSDALRAAGVPSETLRRTYYERINRRSDFDRYFEDLLPFRAGFLPRNLRKEISCPKGQLCPAPRQEDST